MVVDGLKEMRQVKRDWPDRPIIASVMLPMNEASWAKYVPMIEDTGADGFELNFGCPHGMSERGMGAAVGVDGERKFVVKDEECVGCNLCVGVCPIENCITMQQLTEGEDPRTELAVNPESADWTTHANNPLRE